MRFCGVNVDCSDEFLLFFKIATILPNSLKGMPTVFPQLNEVMLKRKLSTFVIITGVCWNQHASVDFYFRLITQLIFVWNVYLMLPSKYLH